MIIIQLKGGLGNQLFLVALGEYLKSLSIIVKYDIYTGFENDYKYNRKLVIFGLIKKNDILFPKMSFGLYLIKFTAKLFPIFINNILSNGVEPIEHLFSRMNNKRIHYLDGYWFDSKLYDANVNLNFLNNVCKVLDLNHVSSQNSVAIHLRIYNESNYVNEVNDFFEMHHEIFISLFKSYCNPAKIFSNSNKGSSYLKQKITSIYNISINQFSSDNELDDFREAVKSKYFIGSPSTYSLWIAIFIKRAGGSVYLPQDNISSDVFSWIPNIMMSEHLL